MAPVEARFVGSKPCGCSSSRDSHLCSRGRQAMEGRHGRARADWDGKTCRTRGALWAEEEPHGILMQRHARDWGAPPETDLASRKRGALEAAS